MNTDARVPNGKTVRITSRMWIKKAFLIGLKPSMRRLLGYLKKKKKKVRRRRRGCWAGSRWLKTGHEKKVIWIYDLAHTPSAARICCLKCARHFLGSRKHAGGHRASHRWHIFFVTRCCEKPVKKYWDRSLTEWGILQTDTDADTDIDIGDFKRRYIRYVEHLFLDRKYTQTFVEIKMIRYPH